MSKELNEDTSFNISIKSLIGIGVALSTLKDQPKDVQKSISAVPVIVIMDKTGRVRIQYVADLSFKIKASNMEIQNFINKIR